MVWSPAIYVQFPDEATARAAAAGLGVAFPESGEIPTGNENFALKAPADAYVVGSEPREKLPGYWALLRLNTNWAGYAATMAAIADVIRPELVDGVRQFEPGVVWA